MPTDTVRLTVDGQAQSQPLIVAYMTEAAEISANDRVLEIGTGSGYQAAILGGLRASVTFGKVLTMCRLPSRKFHIRCPSLRSRTTLMSFPKYRHGWR